METKLCVKCGIEKSYEEYRKVNSKYRERTCLECKREEWRLLAKKSREANTSKCKKWRNENRGKYRESEARYLQKLKDITYETYGGYVCACCGEKERAFLSLDHIQNNGADHREVISGKRRGNGTGKGLFLWLQRQNYPKGLLQVLCHNCNMGKHLNGGICPHQKS